MRQICLSNIVYNNKSTNDSRLIYFLFYLIYLLYSSSTFTPNIMPRPFYENSDEELYAEPSSETSELIVLSKQYGWSSHNCSCNRSKTGLVLYPSNKQWKNIVLLCCEVCYDYQSNTGKTQHQQLHDWYYKLYGDSKDFVVISGFSQETDGTFKFNSGTFNLRGPYSTRQRELELFEQNIIKIVVKEKCEKYCMS